MALEDAALRLLLLQRLGDQPASVYRLPTFAAKALGKDGLEFWQDNDFKASASTTVLLDALELHADTLKLNCDALRAAICSGRPRSS
jgi:hypothetical protein